MTTSSPFPPLPVCQVTIASTALTRAALAYIKEHNTPCTVNHVLRSTAFALLLQRKFPPLATANIDTEALVLSTLLHDLGWSLNHSIRTQHKRFEVDSADAARAFILSQVQVQVQPQPQSQSQSTSNGTSPSPNSNPTKTATHRAWDAHRLQLLWDAISLHTTPSIAHHKEPEVFACQLGISADFFGPNLPLPTPITVDEYREIVTAFPRLGFGDEVKEIMCGLCREKPETTMDNVVSGFGRVYGMDGAGDGKEEWLRRCEEKETARILMGGLEGCRAFE